LVVRVRRPDAEWDPDRAGVHAARTPRSRVRDDVGRGPQPAAARERPALLLPPYRPGECDVERDLPEARIPAGLRFGLAGARSPPGGRPANGEPNRASSPSDPSIRSSWLYLAVRSPRDGAPDFICPAFVATARSAIVVSSVSPLRCETTTPKLARWAASIAS